MNKRESYPRAVENVERIRIGTCRYSKQIYLLAHGDCSDGKIGTIVEDTANWTETEAMYNCAGCGEEVLSRPIGICM